MPSALDAIHVFEWCLGMTLWWTKTNRIKLNLDKTEMVMFKGSPSTTHRLDGVSLSYRYQVCNLGVFLDPSLSMEHQILVVAKSALSQFWHIAQLHPTKVPYGISFTGSLKGRLL